MKKPRIQQGCGVIFWADTGEDRETRFTHWHKACFSPHKTHGLISMKGTPQMRFHPAILGAGALLALSACAPASGPSASADACKTAVRLALAYLPDGLVGEVTEIEAGMSGKAVSCAVTGTHARVMVDATLACPEGTGDLSACTQIDGIHAMDGSRIWP